MKKTIIQFRTVMGSCLLTTLSPPPLWPTHTLSTRLTMSLPASLHTSKPPLPYPPLSIHCNLALPANLLQLSTRFALRVTWWFVIFLFFLWCTRHFTFFPSGAQDISFLLLLWFTRHLFPFFLLLLMHKTFSFFFPFWCTKHLTSSHFFLLSGAQDISLPSFIPLVHKTFPFLFSLWCTRHLFSPLSGAQDIFLLFSLVHKAFHFLPLFLFGAQDILLKVILMQQLPVTLTSEGRRKGKGVLCFSLSPLD